MFRNRPKYDYINEDTQVVIDLCEVKLSICCELCLFVAHFFRMP